MAIKMPQRKPRLLVGSSSEGRDVAEAVRDHLGDAGLDLHLWSDPGVFELSHTAIESLEAARDAFDFAVLILTPDDVVKVRGSEYSVPRDNLIFELGMFVGSIGRRRAFLFAPLEPCVKLPTDLAGVIVAFYGIRHDNQPYDVGAACAKVQRAIRNAPRSRLESVLYSLIMPPVTLKYALWRFEQYLKDVEADKRVFPCDAQVTTVDEAGLIVQHTHPSVIGHSVRDHEGRIIWSSFDVEDRKHPARAIVDTDVGRGWIAWLDTGYSMLYTPVSRRDNDRLCIVHFRRTTNNRIELLECHQELAEVLDECLINVVAGIIEKRIGEIDEADAGRDE